MKRIWILAGCIIFSCGAMWSNLAFVHAQITPGIPMTRPKLEIIIPGADLTLIPVHSVDEFCKNSLPYLDPKYLGYSDGKMLILVKNKGSFTAPASTTQVHWFQGTTVLLATPSIPPGGIIGLTTTLKKDICIVKVDSKNQVTESNESNNIYQVYLDKCWNAQYVK